MRDFISNAALLVVLNLAVKGFYLFGIDRTVQNVLPAGEYGLYFTLFNFAYLFQIVADFGLHNYNSRNLAQGRHLIGKYFPYLLALKGLLSVGYLAIVLVAGYFWGFEPRARFFLLLIGFNLVLQALFLYLRSNFAGLGQYRTDSLLSVLDKLLLTVICGALLLLPHFDLLRFVLAQTTAWVLTLVIAGLLLRPYLQGLVWRLRPRVFWVLLRRSAPFALVIFLMTAYTRVDGIMIERLLENGRIEADLYASAFRLLDAANIAGFLIAGLLLPMFSRQLAQRESPFELARLGAGALGAGAISLAAAVWAFGTPIMETLYTDGSAYSGSILTLLMFSFVAMSGGYIYGTLLTAAGVLGRMNRYFALGVLGNIGLNWWLIPVYGAYGAALATCVTQFALLAAQLWIVHRTFGVGTNGRWLLRLLVFALLSFGIAELYGGPWLTSTPWFVKFVCCVSTTLALSFLLGLIDLRQWIRVLLADR